MSKVSEKQKAGNQLGTGNNDAQILDLYVEKNSTG